MNEVIVKTRGITKKYGAAAAVRDLSIQVRRGEIYALVGQNGAGKTTLLKLICGLAEPTAGGLELFGQAAPKWLGRARSRIGSMIETPGFFPYLSAGQNLEFYRIQRGVRGAGCVRRALRLVGLAGTGRKKFRSFSLGMKQRLGLALAVMNDPQILVLDEPINGLDPVGIREFRDILQRLNREKQTTVLISSHILGELSQFATDYGFIRDGRLLEHISAADLKEKCRSCLRIEADSAERAAAVLREKCACPSVEALGKTELRVNGNPEHPELLVRALVENGVQVSQVYRSGISLEQYFVNLIGGKEVA